MHDSCQTRSSLHQLRVLELVVLLVLEQLADLEPSQLAADVVLHLDQVQELETLRRLLEQDPQLVVVGGVHRQLYK